MSSRSSRKIRNVGKVGTATALVASGLVAGGVLASTLTASAATSPSPSTSASTSRPMFPNNETAVTDSAKLAGIKAAVLAKYPNATVGDITTDGASGYEARITTSAGQHLDVLLDSGYAVTGTESHAGGPGGPGGHMRGNGVGPGETVITDSAKLSSIKAAVLAKYPNATFGPISTERAGGYEARITTSAGQHLDVLLNSAYAVTGTESHPAMGPRPDGAPSGSMNG